MAVVASRAAVTAATAAGASTAYVSTGEMAMRTMIITLALVLVACTSRPPVPAADAPRPAIDIRYVGVASMKIYAQPAEVAPVITTYGYTETVSILARKGDWVEVRTVDGSGWARAADLIGVEQVEPILKNPSPRLATAPVAIPNPRARGEIVIEAKVNTYGEVVSVRVVKNTTGLQRLADANAAALQQATFYPIVQKGRRLAFTYAYNVTY
jgi:hypothetical protein